MRAKAEKVRARILGLLKQAGIATNVSAAVQKEFELSVSQVTRYLAGLENDGLISSFGYGKGKKYQLASHLKVRPLHRKVFKLAELDQMGEDIVYDLEILPLLGDCNENAIACIRHASTELINNVIDHSKAKEMSLTILKQNDCVVIEIKDDGIGVFESIKKFFSLPNYMEGVTELNKGKRTTDAQRHAGEGIFFSQRMVDRFYISANNLQYEFFGKKMDWAISESPTKIGSLVCFFVDQNTSVSPEIVFKRYMNSDFEFSRSDSFLVQPYYISVGESVVSRSEAKKLLAGAEEFEEIVLDFLGTKRIGQGFADEVFRVFKNSHPQIKLSHKNANASITMMIKHVKK